MINKENNLFLIGFAFLDYLEAHFQVISRCGSNHKMQSYQPGRITAILEKPFDCLCLVCRNCIIHCIIFVRIS